MRNRLLTCMLTAALLGVGTIAAGAATTPITAFAEEAQGQVLLDEDGRYVEFRGVYEESSSSWILNMYIENNTEETFYVSFSDAVIDGCLMSISNNNVEITPGSKFLAEPNFKYVLDVEDFGPYGITHMSKLQSTLEIREEMFGDDLVAKDIELELDKDLPPTDVEEIVGEEIANAENVTFSYDGIYKYSDNNWVLKTVTQNDRDEEVYVQLSDAVINGYSIGIGNNGRAIPAHTKFTTGQNFNYVIGVDDLTSYGITEIESIKANLQFKTSLFGDVIYEQPIELTDPDASVVNNSENETAEVTSEQSAESASTESREVLGEVLMDEDGKYVEYRGISEYSNSSWLVNLYVENNTDTAFFVALTEPVIDGCLFSLGNSSVEVLPGAKFLAEPNFNYVLSVEDFGPYGITHMSKLNTSLEIRQSMFDDVLVSKEIELDVDKDIPPAELEETVGHVIADSGNVTFSYDGIYEYSDQSWVLKTVVENNSDAPVCVYFDDMAINGYSVNIGNNGRLIPAHTKYTTGPNFTYVIDVEDLDAYGITEIESITANLKFSETYYGDAFYEQDVDLMATTAAEVQTEAATEVQTEAATEVQTEAATEVQTEAPTEVQTEPATEVETEEAITDPEIIKSVQVLMNSWGFDCGTADGQLGQKTADAIKAFQRDQGLAETGIITMSVVDRILGGIPYSTFVKRYNEAVDVLNGKKDSLDADSINKLPEEYIEKTFTPNNICELMLGPGPDESKMVGAILLSVLDLETMANANTGTMTAEVVAAIYAFDASTTDTDNAAKVFNDLCKDGATFAHGGITYRNYSSEGKFFVNASYDTYHDKVNGTDNDSSSTEATEVPATADNSTVRLIRDGEVITVLAKTREFGDELTFAETGTEGGAVGYAVMIGKSKFAFIFNEVSDTDSRASIIPLTIDGEKGDEDTLKVCASILGGMVPSLDDDEVKRNIVDLFQSEDGTYSANGIHMSVEDGYIIFTY